MRPKNPKEVLSYCKRKGGWFDPSAKVSTDKKLDQQMIQLSQGLQGRHGRHLFFYNVVGQTLDTIDHLLITGKGLILVEKVPVQKNLTGFDHQWWQHQKTGQLIPNEHYNVQQVGQHLLELLSPVLPEGCPLYTYIIADKIFAPEVVTLAELPTKITSELQSKPEVISATQRQQIEQILSEACQKAVQTKAHQYDLTFYQSHYNPLKPMSTAKRKGEHPLTECYRIMNKWMFEEAPDARLYHHVKLLGVPEKHQVLQTVIVSSKGILLLSYLEPETKINVQVEDAVWKIIRLEQGEFKQLNMDNPMYLLEAQAQHLKKSLNAPIPMTYRIVGLNPIDLELKHPALVLELHLQHALDKYWTEEGVRLTPPQVLWVKQQLGRD